MDPPTLPCELSAVPESAPLPNLTQALVHTSQVKKPMTKLEWKAKRDRIIEREWPLALLAGAALAWTMTNVLLLGFTAAEIVIVKAMAFGFVGLGIAWLGVKAWSLLRRSRE